MPDAGAGFLIQTGTRRRKNKALSLSTGDTEVSLLLALSMIPL